MRSSQAVAAIGRASEHLRAKIVARLTERVASGYLDAALDAGTIAWIATLAASLAHDALVEPYRRAAALERECSALRDELAARR